VKNYYKLFDEKLENSTLVVLIIALIIVLFWSVVQNQSIDIYSKSNLLERTHEPIPSLSNQDIIFIEWKKYQVVFQETK
jgi:hypothetical protein